MLDGWFSSGAPSLLLLRSQSCASTASLSAKLQEVQLEPRGYLHCGSSPFLEVLYRARYTGIKNLLCCTEPQEMVGKGGT